MYLPDILVKLPVSNNWSPLPVPFEFTYGVWSNSNILYSLLDKSELFPYFISNWYLVGLWLNDPEGCVDGAAAFGANVVNDEPIFL